jgi:hypothetical protein
MQQLREWVCSGSDSRRNCVRKRNVPTRGSRGAARGYNLFIGALEKAIEAGAADAEHLRGAHAVAFAHFENTLDVDTSDFVKWNRVPGL